MLQDVIDRVNQARKKAQLNPHFQLSAQQHAKAIESEQTPTKPITQKKCKTKNKSLADVYKPYFNTESPH